SDDDGAVPPVSSTRYYNALKEHGIPDTMHISPSGGHGWGMKESFEYKAEWRHELAEWLKKL
ncbi:MAG: S9 family peptidase, partial [Alistipes sp.]|nr:S9 family peptidase [Alistipes sp.]